MSKFQTKEFKALEAKWYKKLKSKGFEDIEQDEDNLKVWINDYFPQRYDLSRFDAKQEYYRLAGQFTFEHPFESPLDRRMWELHAEGVSLRSIVTELNKNRTHKLNKDGVHAKIKAFRAIMADKCFKRKT